ncbi:MAG TPA: transcription termination/antitermination protein NusA, partial [Rhodospirillaceae bacterium]|nr:transcription termination/antitermination protein NusA [Rhodospirillaceae bacterium]
GEKIDIIPWNDEDPTFVVNALAPAEVTKVVMDPDTNTIEVVVPDEQLSLAIGRRGQNVRLASMLTGWNIDIMTEEQESEKRQREFVERSELFMEALDVDDMIAQLLVTEGFTSVEEVAYVPVDEMATIEGFDEEVAEALSDRASAYLDEQNRLLEEKRRNLGVTDDLATYTGFTNKQLIKLGEEKICTIEDFAGLAADELTDPADGLLRGDDLTEAEANIMVMNARVKVGWLTQEELDQMLAEQAAAEAAEEEA